MMVMAKMKVAAAIGLAVFVLVGVGVEVTRGALAQDRHPSTATATATTSPDALKTAAVAANQRLVFAPKAGSAGASWSRLTPMQDVAGVSMAHAYSPLGGHFPIQDQDDRTLFKVQVLDGDDKHLFVEVSATDYLGQFDLPRDKAVSVKVAGKRYEIVYPTVTVSATAPPTTDKAMIIVTRGP